MQSACFNLMLSGLVMFFAGWQPLFLFHSKDEANRIWIVGLMVELPS
jgi:hypothetical protein